MTKAQKWARERNGVKFVLLGIKKNLINLSEKTCLLATEKKELKRAVLFLNETLGSWKLRNGLSKKKFIEGGK